MLSQFVEFLGMGSLELGIVSELSGVFLWSRKQDSSQVVRTAGLENIV